MTAPKDRTAGQLRLRLAAGGPWEVIRDADADGREIYRRHYSRRVYADGRDPAKFVGPGQHVVLITPELGALFVWRKFIDDADDGSGERQGGGELRRLPERASGSPPVERTHPRRRAPCLGEVARGAEALHLRGSGPDAAETRSGPLFPEGVLDALRPHQGRPRHLGEASSGRRKGGRDGSPVN